jgi:hypothetical protein
MPWLGRIVAEEPKVRPGSVPAYLIATALVAGATVVRLLLGNALVGVPFLTFSPRSFWRFISEGLGRGFSPRL